MKFIADRMLGKLAKKLRLLGFDTLYYPEISEDELLAKSHDRILLTRDKILYRKAKKLGYEVFYLKSDIWRSQLKALAKVYPVVEKARPFTRCSVCNSELIEVDRESVKDSVPEYVYKSADSFKICKGCGKVYWRGTHVDLILRDLRELMGL